LPVAEIVDWVATFVYLPKLRDRVVLETAIRDALAKLDPKFACAEDFDEGSGKYAGLLWHKAPIGPMPPTALLCDRRIAVAQLRAAAPTPLPESARHRWRTALVPSRRSLRAAPERATSAVLRFFGSVGDRYDSAGKGIPRHPERGGDGIAALQRHKGEANLGDRGRRGYRLVRDNARQLKFRPESTGFE
jgi:hypothetical protein